MGNRTLRSKIDCYRDVLSKLITASEGNSTRPTREKISCLKPLNRGIEIITPNIKARATVYSQQVKGKGFIQDTSQGQINVCAICKKSHDQHLLAHCDQCKLHYHLGCLTPPLTRMPKKSGYYGWSCSECYPDSSDSNPDLSNIHDDEGSSDAATQKRNRKRRLAASKVDTTQAPKPKIKNIKKHVTASESTKSLYEAASNAASALLSTQEELDLPNLDSSDSIDPTKAAKAAAKAERKQVKKAEKERRKMEKKKRKILEKQQQQMQGMESDSTRRQAIDVEAKEKDQITEESEDDVEIVEDEN